MTSPVLGFCSLLARWRTVLYSVLLLVSGGPLLASERIFVLQDSTHLRQYRIDFEGPVSMVHPYAAPPAQNTLEASYSNSDFFQAFPAATIEMKSGNILSTYDGNKKLLARFHYDPASNRLQAYQGNPGSPASPQGRILESPNLAENFRAEDSLYGRTKKNNYRASLLLEKVRRSAGPDAPVRFVLDGQVFSLSGDHISRWTRSDGALLPAPELALTLPGSQLTAVAVSPWDEGFISDPARPAIQRVLIHDGALMSNGTIQDPNLRRPGGLAFDPDGELFVANSGGGPFGVLRFQLVLDNFVSWRAVEEGGLSLPGGALDVALVRPVGYVLSEKEKPLVKAVGTGPHHGIAQSLLVYPSVNSQAAVLALVEYEAGGFTAVHLHPQMEQMEIVIAGRALWEVGEMEREVGPGDVIYCPRNVKHGYKVLGDSPFKFYQIEWPGPGLYQSN